MTNQQHVQYFMDHYTTGPIAQKTRLTQWMGVFLAYCNEHRLDFYDFRLWINDENKLEIQVVGPLFLITEICSDNDLDPLYMITEICNDNDIETLVVIPSYFTDLETAKRTVRECVEEIIKDDEEDREETLDDLEFHVINEERINCSLNDIVLFQIHTLTRS